MLRGASHSSLGWGTQGSPLCPRPDTSAPWLSTFQPGMRQPERHSSPVPCSGLDGARGETRTPGPYCSMGHGESLVLPSLSWDGTPGGTQLPSAPCSGLTQGTRRTWCFPVLSTPSWDWHGEGHRPPVLCCLSQVWPWTFWVSLCWVSLCWAVTGGAVGAGHRAVAHPSSHSQGKELPTVPAGVKQEPGRGRWCPQTFRTVCIAFSLLTLDFESGNILTSLADTHFFCIN